MTFTFQYLKEHRKSIFMQLIFVLVFVVVFYLYHLPLAAVLYPSGICLVIGGMFVCFSIRRAYENHKKRTEIQSLPGLLVQGALEENTGIQGRDYQQIILKLCGEIQSLESEKSASYQEMLDYFTVWVHQIKTPIASMRLHLEAEDSKLSRRLKSDLLHIEQYVEMVLTYFKMDSDDVSDYVFRSVSVDKIIKENIRKLRGDFILKKLSLVYVPFDGTIISDEKWLSFVIGQILSNALKYTKEGSVTIAMEESKTLCIRDTGIGISPEDLPRIFEKGYTGANGRGDKRASGLGLYLCRQICARLGHQILVRSEIETGTEVRIDLSQYHRIYE